MMREWQFDWSELAFGSKKPLRSLRPIFITAPREFTAKRFTQLIKTYLPQGNIVLGLAKEPFVDGFDGQPQFKTSRLADVQSMVEKVNAANSPHKIVVLHYFQRELPFILEKIGLRQAVFINGSWSGYFHTKPVFYQLVKQGVPYKLISPFADETEAKEYAGNYSFELPQPTKPLSADEALALASQAAKQSFDHGFQTGACLARQKGKKYEYLAATFNKVVPYQTYAWHYGSARERHLSPTNDLNYYDAVHAETMLLIEAQKRGISLKNATLFINLLPCPTCARMLVETGISEIVYRIDHSDGYCVQLFEQAGKKVTRLVPKEGL